METEIKGEKVGQRDGILEVKTEVESCFFVVDRRVEFDDFQGAGSEKMAVKSVFDLFGGRRRCVLQLEPVLKPVLDMTAAG